jgi:hypothetical protein
MSSTGQRTDCRLEGGYSVEFLHTDVAHALEPEDGVAWEKFGTPGRSGARIELED